MWKLLVRVINDFYSMERMRKGQSRMENGWGLHAKVNNIVAGVVGAVEDVLR